MMDNPQNNGITSKFIVYDEDKSKMVAFDHKDDIQNNCYFVPMIDEKLWGNIFTTAEQCAKCKKNYCYCRKPRVRQRQMHIKQLDLKLF